MITIDRNTSARIAAWPDSNDWPITGLYDDPAPAISTAALTFYEHAIERLSGLDRIYRPALWGAVGGEEDEG